MDYHCQLCFKFFEVYTINFQKKDTKYRISNVKKLNNQGRTIRFKIVERKGVTLEEKLRKPNPRATLEAMC